jgi:hypothetical protein
MNKEQIMNKKLKQLHNINKAMQSALHPGIKQLWMDKFHELVLNFVICILKQQVDTWKKLEKLRYKKIIL